MTKDCCYALEKVCDGGYRDGDGDDGGGNEEEKGEEKRKMKRWRRKIREKQVHEDE